MVSLTPDQSRKIGLGIAPSPAPFLTPRPERRRLDSYSFRHDKEVNVQVLLRCRPLSDEEQRLNVPKVISCNEHKREATVLHTFANKQVDKVFTFDKVFGPKAQQRSIYDQAIAPIVNEVLDGFNCTVFAYGQTGTGKTYTMEGGMRNKGGDLPAEAGVIPRSVRHIFDTLEAQNADYSMKVTFLELYNEEIYDLLAPDDNSRSTEDKQKKPISLMEDGKGCVIVRGLEEEAVYSANDIYTLLERGAAKRRTADTLLNKRSSRSHSVFSINVYIKESGVRDEELIKCGKLSLVDLAGSENISRSGAREGRAREAGEINKSLLTLGRVINALVERSGHIPYRDSKLTRLLRDSLGGKTKTCIIATISPSAHSLEETLSTLDYAYRAKTIKTKPEVNQKISKAVLLKDLYMEIERMKEDVRAARDKNGVFVPHERYVQEEAEKKARIHKIQELENDLYLSEKQVGNYHELYLTEQEQKLDLQSELKDCKINLEKNEKSLLDLQENYRIAMLTLKAKESIISKLQCSECSLIERAKDMRSALQHASDDINSLFSKLDQKDNMEAKNHSSILKFGSQLDQSLKELHKMILGSISQQNQQLRCMEEFSRTFLASKSDATEILELRIKSMTETYTTRVASLKEFSSTVRSKASIDLEQMNSIMSSQINAFEQLFVTAVSDAKKFIEDTQISLNEQKEILAFSAQQQEEGLRQNLISAQEISKATVAIFIDLHQQANEVVGVLEEIQIEKSRQLDSFEKTFKDEAAEEEKQALEKISVILANLTSKKNDMISEASRNFHETNIRDKKRLQHQMTNMQQVSADAKKDLDIYIEQVENGFLENTFSAAESRAIMESNLQELSAKVDQSSKHWNITQVKVHDINETSTRELGATIKEKINTNERLHEEFMSVSSTIDAEFRAGACSLKRGVHDLLAQDRESSNHIDSQVTLGFDKLKALQDNHGTSISIIRSQAENCFLNDYLVDRDTTPNKRVIVVPSLTSIEEMRTPSMENLNGDNASENKSKCVQVETKMQQQLMNVMVSPDRTPFSNVN